MCVIFPKIKLKVTLNCAYQRNLQNERSKKVFIKIAACVGRPLLLHYVKIKLCRRRVKRKLLLFFLLKTN